MPPIPMLGGRCFKSLAIVWHDLAPPECCERCDFQAIRCAQFCCIAQCKRFVAVFLAGCSLALCDTCWPTRWACLLTYSGPLSTRNIAGFPRHAITWFRLRTTRAAGSEKPTSMANPSRLKSSKMFNVRNDFPFHNWSDIKSIDHTWLGRSGTDNGSGCSRFNRLRGLMRWFSSSLK